MSTIDTSTWNPDADLNVEIEGIPLNADASIVQTWQVIRILMAAFKGDTRAIQALMVPFSGATASADGVQGFVPAPEAGDENKMLKGNGTWGTLSASDIPNIDASAITSGTIDLARLPAGALERLVTVADQTARYALTTASVQLGDTVKQLDTGVMYVVVDTSKLGQAAGYVEYTAGSAASVPWSGVTGKPSSFTPSSHAHGNLTNDGKIGSTASLPLITGTGGVVQAGSFGTAAGTFCEGSDSRLSNARTPTAHASSTAVYGVSSTSDYGHAKASSTTPKANGTASAGSETDAFARGDHVHPLQTSVSGSAGSVPWSGVTDKPSTIAYTDGDVSFSGTVSANNFRGRSSIYNVELPENGSSTRLLPVCFRSNLDYARANSIAFLGDSRSIIEYSINGGTTWLDYGASSDEKKKLFAMMRSDGFFFYLGKGSSGGTSSMNTDCKLRVTIISSGTYCEADSIFVWVSDYGHTMMVDVETSTCGNQTNFNIIRSNVSISGWSGGNLISIPKITFGSYTPATTPNNIYAIRLTFHCSKISSQTNLYPVVFDIRMFSPIRYVAPNSMAKCDHIYSWDQNGNAIFQSKVTTNSSFEINKSGQSMIGFVSQGNSASVNNWQLLAGIGSSGNGGFYDATRAMFFFTRDPSSGQVNIQAYNNDKSAIKTFALHPDGSIYWGGQAIHTASDERLKTPLKCVPDEVLDAWGEVDWGEFKFLDAVDCKGETARLHLGLIAQRVKAVFEERKLDACAYGILCHENHPAIDEEFTVVDVEGYTDEYGVEHQAETHMEKRHEDAIDVWTVRYAEALSMEAAYQRRRADRLEARLSALEEKLNA